MVSSKEGYRYENELALDTYRRTNGELLPITTRSSGNVSMPLPDMLIDDGETVHAFEIKRTSRDKVTFEYDDDFDVLPTDDIYQLLLFAQIYPRTVRPYLGVRFPNRQLIIVRLWPDNDARGVKTVREILDQAVKMCPIECKRTYTDNFIVYKPDTSTWPSAQAGDDVEHLLRSIGYAS